VSVRIAPSALSADLGRLRDQIAEIERGGADWVHVDVMDGRFVPNLTFGAPLIRALRKLTALPLDVHLMVEQPEKYIDDFAGAGAAVFTFHPASGTGEFAGIPATAEAQVVKIADGIAYINHDLDDAIRRLQAYAEAGADVLYAPGIRTREQIAAVVAAVAPKPVNLLVGFPTELTLRDIEALGVRRVSVGGALARSAWGGFMRAAQAIAGEGRFDGFAQAASGAELNALFGPGR